MASLITRESRWFILVLSLFSACSDSSGDRPVEPRNGNTIRSSDSTVKYPDSQLVSPEQVSAGFIIEVTEDVLEATHFVITVRSQGGGIAFFKAIAMPPAGTVLGVPVTDTGVFSVIVKAYNQPTKTVVDQRQSEVALSEETKVMKLSFAPDQSSKEMVVLE